MQWARYWLCQTAHPVDEIVLDLGFADVSTFSRAFRRRTSRSPSEERRQGATAGAP
ncbi:helix-turn-helix domain-containing protein [Halomonas halmophila]|uniref:helix-turn-helix domain-containing protein n=1 Tax=Halomonas halmophila TaxID=252 RepID=UPI001142515C